ncbi:MAG: efflux transporter outer membrane subunit, partial [Planctomycetota bacterium]
ASPEFSSVWIDSPLVNTLHRLILLVISLPLAGSGCAQVSMRGATETTTAATGDWSHDANVPGVATENELQRWWNLLDDPALVETIGRALEQSPTLAEARERLDIARARRRLESANSRPSLDGFASRERSETGDEGFVLGGALPGAEVDIYSLGAGFEWESDLWGRADGLIGAAEADVSAAREDLRAARVALVAEVAQELYRLRAHRLDLEAVDAFVEEDRETLAVLEARFSAGVATELDVEKARVTLASTLALRPSISSAARETEIRLAVLVGEPPQEFSSQTGGLPSGYILPELGVPASLLLRRPDIRGALYEVEAARLRASSARAERFPSISLSGTFALQGTDVGAMTNPNASILTIGQSLVLPLFDRREIQARITEAEGNERIALIGLQSTVLAALSEVERAAVTREASARRAEALARAIEAASRSEALARERYVSGIGDYLDIADARRSRLELVRDELRARRDELIGLVDLYGALGGGWDPISDEGYPEIPVTFSTQPADDR